MAYTTIDDPTKYFDVTLWTGDGGARTITGLNHKPDLIWAKPRSVAYNHMWSDSTRGFNANSELGSNSTAAEGGLSAETYGYKSGHTSDGWTMVDGTDTVDSQEDGTTTQPSVTYVGWTWAANGGTTTTNDASATSVGSIDSVYQANTTAGFSIVTYTGTGSNGTIAHGLGSTPKWYFVKNRSESSVSSTDQAWIVYHSVMAHGAAMFLNTTDSKMNHSPFWNSTAPTSTTFSVGTDSRTNTSADNYIAYCFSEVQGYSKFGSYKGNGNADGPFVYTGFKPAFMIAKEYGASRNWTMADSLSQTAGNGGVTNSQQPNVAGAKDANERMDWLSNGFKIRNTSTTWNTSGGTFIYIAFAEHPFVSSKGIPTTAR